MEKSIEEIRSDFPFLDTDVIYLDNAATALTPEPAIEAMEEYFREYNANIGRGLHEATKRASEEFEGARGKVANLINAGPEELVFTKNSTEALNLLARGLGLEEGDKVVTTVLEHHSNLIPWQKLAEEKGIKLKIVHDNDNLIIDPSAIASAIDDDTELVTMTHVSNAFGTRQPVEEVGKIAEEEGVLFSVDASQSVGYEPVDVSKIGCDFLAAPGHKGMLGPQGTGILYISDDIERKITPLLYGGGMVESVRETGAEFVESPQIFDGGTPNIPGFIALGGAVDYLQDIGVDRVKERKNELTEILLELGEEAKVDTFGPDNPDKLGGILSFNIEGLDQHEVSSILDEAEGIATRSGYHCAEPAFDFLDIPGSVRASVNFYNNESEVRTLLSVVSKIVRDLI